ncbi:MAG: serine/threonine protein kinase [Oscillatoriaceae cyanobacterium Prado104]|jgi:serine/threonine-protein kinase|nr:serine/threonine protein kinase [Oscillatoriaceae cyanobacterium Prado104]
MNAESTTNMMNAEAATNLLNNFVLEQKGQPLDRLQQAIVQGVLEGMTYQEIKDNYPIARHFSIGFLARCKAYDLWKLLTEIFQDAGIISPDEKVRNKNLWESIMRLKQHIEKSESADDRPPVPLDSMLDRKLRMRYRVTEHLVSTEFSDTYLAEDEDVPDRPLCAVKRLKSQADETTKLFEREARVLCKLGKHDRIPELLARFQEDGYFYLIMQFIEGQPLSQELKEGQPWEEHEVCALLQEILEILAFVHQHDVIHRDVHPDNLIRRANDSKIVLIDFGTVKEINLSQNSRGQTQSRGGTHREYMPPEQAIGSPKLCSDVYAVGLLGIQALTGLSPKELKVNQETGDLMWREKARVSSKFACFLDNMVRYHFPQRYPSAIEALQALKNLC